VPGTVNRVPCAVYRAPCAVYRAPCALYLKPCALCLVDDSITITLRSYVLPPGSEDDFPLGQPLPFGISPGTRVEKLLEKLFGERANQVGMVVINGKVAESMTPLKDGDRVDVFEILGGG
jgi:sulfur carrier protein ThiS